MESSKKHTLLQKTVLTTLVLSVILSSSLLAFPKKVSAVAIPVAVPTADILNTLQITETSVATGWKVIEDQVLNKLATQIAKAMLNRMTASIINWINTGFQGQPSFLTDPNAFFNNIAKEQTNIFVIKLVGEQTNNPYAIDLAYSILNPSKNGFTLYDDMARNCRSRGGGNTCPPDLSTPYAREAYARQFIYGNVWGPSGWSNWYSLTQYNKNNIYGAYLEAERDLARRKAQASGYAQQDLLQSGGFLSFKKCVHEVSYSAESGDADDNPNISAGDTVKYCDKWETQTPGKAAADLLGISITSPTRQSELADTFWKSLSLIVEAFVNQVTMMGVKALSDEVAGVVSGGGNTPSFNPGSFTSQLVTPTNPSFTNQDSQESTQTVAIKDVDTSIKNESDYRTAKNNVLAILTGAETSLGTLTACYYRIVALDQNYRTVEPVASGLAFASTTVRDVINPQKLSLAQATTSSALNTVRLEDFRQRLTSATSDSQFSTIYQDFLAFKTTIHGASDVIQINLNEASQAESLVTNVITPRITACQAKEDQIRIETQNITNPSGD